MQLLAGKFLNGCWNCLLLSSYIVRMRVGFLHGIDMKRSFQPVAAWWGCVIKTGEEYRIFSNSLPNISMFDIKSISLKEKHENSKTDHTKQKMILINKIL